MDNSMGRINNNDSLIHQMVYTFTLTELQTIIGDLLDQVIYYGKKQSLCNRLLIMLKSSDPFQKWIVEQKIVEVYESRSTQQLASVNQSYTPPIQKLIPTNGTKNKKINFAHNQPFFKTIGTILQPKYCKGYIGCTQFEGTYYLSEITRNDFVQSWDIAEKEYKLKIILRLEQFGQKSFKGCLPSNVRVFVNGHQCMLPMLRFTIDQGRKITPYRVSDPIEITEYTDFKTCAKNTITISWSNEPHSYVAGVYVVQRLTWKNLLAKLKNRPFCILEKTIELIKNSIRTTGMGKDFMFTTIQDPITSLRMKLPARGINCTHLQCFDAIYFLEMNDHSQTWSCAICYKTIQFENMEIDEFFLRIVQSQNLSKECENIILFEDGTWAESNFNRFSNNSSTNSCGSTNNNIVRF